MLRLAAIGTCVLNLAVNAQSEEEKHDQYSRSLKFRPDGSFKIVTFSDLMESEGSEEYLLNQSLIESVLTNEDPDLVVFTGDIVDPKQAAEYDYHFSHALELIKARQVPYVWTGGNKVEGKSQYDLHEIDYGYGMGLSWTGYVWDQHSDGTADDGHKVYDQDKLGYFTSRIPIMDPNKDHEVLSVYTIDTSHDHCKQYDLPGETCPSSDSLSWFADQMNLYSTEHKLRDFVFLHKPVPEYMHLANRHSISGHKQQAISCHAVNTGLFATALDSGKVVWINSGYDVDNDFSGRYNDEMMLSYARKSGSSGKGDLPRGVRAFNLTLTHHGSMHGLSYVIEGETGERSTDMHERSPPNFGFSLQTQCSVDPLADIISEVGMADYITQ